MRVSSKIELVVAAILIAYSAFTPRFQPVRDFLESGLGKALALIGVVYVYRSVSPLIALLMVVALCRSMFTQSWEGFDVPTPKCKNGSPVMKTSAGDFKCSDDSLPACPPAKGDTATYPYDVKTGKCTTLNAGQGTTTASEQLAGQPLPMPLPKKDHSSVEGVAKDSTAALVSHGTGKNTTLPATTGLTGVGGQGATGAASVPPSTGPMPAAGAKATPGSA
jgi:hypothetical protein